jgi:hypothetical protein
MNPDIPQKRAEQLFKKEKRAHDARNAMIEYEQQAVATREKITRLRELRLAKEARDRPIALCGSYIAMLPRRRPS